MVSNEPSILYTIVTDDDVEMNHSDEEYVASSQSESDNDIEEKDLQAPVIPVTENTIPISNVIQEVQVLFQMGCMYNRACSPNYVFKFLFWCFVPCIDGFQYCRPVISADGTHLRGSYKGVLLITSTWDANNHLFSLSFAIVDKESSES
ncbi:hypothetical protein M9H77_01905 [Catharanthus roseus]|uniref:Uncharacterized protein n=1 Tax=Catharanthus roseus TaxID=4058 RepID=A0ACC0C6T6_CATRO|nr:hypothetical protein M9H77_01905 [Catharanthus roseus]